MKTYQWRGERKKREALTRKKNHETDQKDKETQSDEEISAEWKGAKPKRGKKPCEENGDEYAK